MCSWAHRRDCQGKTLANTVTIRVGRLMDLEWHGTNRVTVRTVEELVQALDQIAGASKQGMSFSVELTNCLSLRDPVGAG